MKGNTLRFILFIIIIAICWQMGLHFKFDVQYYRDLLAKVPVYLSGKAFILVYVLTTTFIWFGPKDVLRLSAAILFGAYVSTVFVTIAELCNATILFFLSRKLGREFIKQKFKVKDKQLDQAQKNSGFWGVMAFRLNLLFPLRFIDLGYGLTQISFKKFLFASICSTPFRIFVQQYIMAMVGERLFTDMAYTMETIQKDKFIIGCVFIYIIVLIVVTLIAIIMKAMNKPKGVKTT